MASDKQEFKRIKQTLLFRPDHVQACIAHMRNLAITHDMDRLYRSYLRARKLAPIDPFGYWIALTIAVLRPDLAISNLEKDFKKAVAIDPGLIQTYANAGIIFSRRGDLQRAHGCFKRAHAVDPDDPNINNQLWKLDGGLIDGKVGVVGQFTVPGQVSEHRKAFYRTTDARFFPRRLSELADLSEVFRRDVFYGYLPSQPPIKSGEPIIAMGSCFAQNLRAFIRKQGHLSDHVPVPEGLNNTFALRQFVDWLEGRDELLYSYERNVNGQIERWDMDQDREKFREAFANAGGIVATIGLAEVWRDRRTDGVFWRGIADDLYDPEIHKLTLSSVEENCENLRAMVSGLRRLSGNAPIVLTLSPVPLNATMRLNTSIFAADAASKSILRAAIEFVMLDKLENVHYWPSFEAFRWLGAHLDRCTYDGERDPHHPSRDMIEEVVTLFVDHFIEK